MKLCICVRVTKSFSFYFLFFSLSLFLKTLSRSRKMIFLLESVRIECVAADIIQEVKKVLRRERRNFAWLLLFAFESLQKFHFSLRSSFLKKKNLRLDACTTNVPFVINFTRDTFHDLTIITLLAASVLFFIFDFN